MSPFVSMLHIVHQYLPFLRIIDNKLLHLTLYYPLGNITIVRSRRIKLHLIITSHLTRMVATPPDNLVREQIKSEDMTMANLQHVLPNRLETHIERLAEHHSKELEAYRNRFAIGFSLILLICLLAFPVLTPFFVICGVVLYFVLRPIKIDTTRQQTGLYGEQKALGVLTGLPDDYVIFNQVELPFERNGIENTVEADFVVVGPTGIFVVENKEYHGDLSGGERGKWAKGYGTARNPISQVNNYTMLLKRYLQKHGIRQWIYPIVSLSTCNNTSMIDSSRVPVVGVWDLPEVILGRKGRIDAALQMMIVERVAQLRESPV